MGKQINYWMEYESFLKIAEKALSIGFRILRSDDKKIMQCDDISVITKNYRYYYFYMPSLGEIEIRDYGTHEAVWSSGASGNTLIEAGFSSVNNDKRVVYRDRLYVQSGYYAENGNWIERPQELTKAYNTLVRLVKKLAPYTEITDNAMRFGNPDDTFEYKHKEYISPYCLELRDKGYKLKG